MKAKAEFGMHSAPRQLGRFAGCFFLMLLVARGAHGQSCETSGELDDATRAPIAAAAQRYFGMAAKGDAASLKQNAIASLSSDFYAIETTVKDHQQDLSAAQATLKSLFLLETEGTVPTPHAEFYCGVFGKNGQTSGSAVFYLDNLPVGKYAVVILDAASAQARTTFSVVLQQSGAGNSNDWKLGGLYVKPAQAAGHDSDWFAARAREYKSKGQVHNAWFFYQQARTLLSPLPFMTTMATDRLYDEFQSMQPADIPANGKTDNLVVGTTTFAVTAIYPEMVGNDLDLVVKYQAADVANTNLVYQNNTAVMKALVAKYPEVRDAFAAVVARAVDPTGRDYGTLLAMKDIK